jgi:hypothetical protein
MIEQRILDGFEATRNKSELRRREDMGRPPACGWHFRMVVAPAHGRTGSCCPHPGRRDPRPLADAVATMTSPFTRRPDDDPTNIRQWLAGRGGARTMQGTARRELRRYPPEPNDAVAPLPRLEISPQDPRPERLLEADKLARSRQDSRAQEGGQLRPLREAPRDPAIGRVSLL